MQMLERKGQGPDQSKGSVNEGSSFQKAEIAEDDVPF
jgi:hypothetical protein